MTSSRGCAPSCSHNQVLKKCLIQRRSIRAIYNSRYSVAVATSITSKSNQIVNILNKNSLINQITVTLVLTLYG